MTFWHEGVQVTHPRLFRAFLRGVRYLDDEAVFVVQLGHFRGQIEVEDTPWWVTAYDAASGQITLTDQSSEPLDPATLRADSDQGLRCSVKTRFEARFTHAGQSLLLDALELEGPTPRLRAGGAHLPLPVELLDT